MRFFEEILSFKAMYNTKKQTIHLFFTSWILAEGRGQEIRFQVLKGSHTFANKLKSTNFQILVHRVSKFPSAFDTEFKAQFQDLIVIG